MNHAMMMNRIYSPQVKVYDLTRKYFLFGRDSLLEMILDDKPRSVLEVGCGTGRNLLKIAKRAPEVTLCGVDASSIMLDRAKIKCKTYLSNQRLCLKRGLAEEMNYALDFWDHWPFDAVFFSYSLSMMPDWKQGLVAASHALRPGGYLYIVDFFDCAGMPRMLQGAMNKFLAHFKVSFRSELIDFLHFPSGSIRLSQFSTLPFHYAFLAKLQKTCAV